MTKAIAVILGVMVLGGGLAFAEGATPAVEPQAAAAEPIEVGNKICPVSHEEVGKNGMAPHKIVHNGKVYNLCCNMCDKDFNKDPDKFAKIADDEVAATKEAAKGM